MTKDFPCAQCRVPHPIGQHVRGARGEQVLRPAPAALAETIKRMEVAAKDPPAKKIEPAEPVQLSPLGQEIMAGLGEVKAMRDKWADCPHCAARRKKHAERVARYRGKHPQKPS